MKSVFDACCTGPQVVYSGQRPQPAEEGVHSAVKPASTQSGSQSMTSPFTNLLTKMDETVPLFSPVTGVMRDAVTGATGGGSSSQEMDRLNAALITGKGEEKQTFSEAIVRHQLPVVAIFPASAKSALAAISSLTSYPYRNSCARIQLIVRNPDAIPMINAELGHHVTDAVSWTFADYTNILEMTHAFVGVDRLLLVPPNAEDRAELTCNGLQAAKAAGVKHVVLLSAVIAQQPTTLFGRQFRKMETCLEEMRPSVNSTILRMAWFMDNFLDMASDIVSNNRFVASWGPSGIAPVALADIGRAAAAVLSTAKTSETHYNRTFHITGPESLSGARMAETFTKVFGRQISYQDLPREDMKKVYTDAMKVPEWQAEGYVEMNDVFKAGAASAFSTDVAMLTQGSQTTLERFLYSKRWYFMGNKSPLTVVFPASGRVGTYTLTALMRDSSHGRVRAVVRSADAKAELQSRYPSESKLEIVNGDFEDESSVRTALDGADSVLIIPPEKLERFSLIDEAIKIAKDTGASHTVLFSVSKGLDQTALGRKFNAWERVLEMTCPSYTIIQSTLFFDLMFYFAEQVKQPERKVHHWFGSGKFCPVDSRDVGEACAAVLREGPLVHHGKTYSLYGPQRLSFDDMMEKMSTVLGYKIEAVPDITSDQVRLTMQGKLPSFNVEEVVQAHENIAMGRDVGEAPDMLQLVGHAHTFQSFLEEYKFRFQGFAGTPQSHTVQTPVTTPQSTTSQQGYISSSKQMVSPLMEEYTQSEQTMMQQQQQQIQTPAQQQVPPMAMQAQQTSPAMAAQGEKVVVSTEIKTTIPGGAETVQQQQPTVQT